MTRMVDREVGASTGRAHFSDHLLALDGMRGIAAVLVMLHHSSWVLGFNPSPSAHLAVDFFFVLSGFVLALAAERWVQRGDRLQEMLSRRVERLWPMYLIGLMLGLLSAFATQYAGRLWAMKTLAIAAVNALMLPFFPKEGGRVFPFDAPAWSLFFEMLANVPFLFLAKKGLANRSVLLAPISAIALCAMVLHHGSADGGYTAATFKYGFPRVGVSFFLGVGLFHLWSSRQRPRRGNIFILALMVCLCIIAFIMPATIIKDLFAILIIFPITIYYAATVNFSGIIRSAAKLSGDASYPLYIIHAPLIGLMVAGWQALSGKSANAFPKGLMLVVWVAIFCVSVILERRVQPRARDLLAKCLRR